MALSGSDTIKPARLCTKNRYGVVSGVPDKIEKNGPRRVHGDDFSLLFCHMPLRTCFACG